MSLSIVFNCNIKMEAVVDVCVMSQFGMHPNLEFIQIWIVTSHHHHPNLDKDSKLGCIQQSLEDSLNPRSFSPRTYWVDSLW